MFSRLRLTPQGLLDHHVGFVPTVDHRKADYVGKDHVWHLVKNISDFHTQPPVTTGLVLVVCTEAIRQWYDSHLEEWPNMAEHTLFVRLGDVGDLPGGPVERVSTRFRLLATHQTFRPLRIPT